MSSAIGRSHVRPCKSVGLLVDAEREAVHLLTPDSGILVLLHDLVTQWDKMVQLVTACFEQVNVSHDAGVEDCLYETLLDNALYEPGRRTEASTSIDDTCVNPSCQCGSQVNQMDSVEDQVTFIPSPPSQGNDDPIVISHVASVRPGRRYSRMDE